MLAALQDANVSDDGPAVLRLYLCGVIGHEAEAVGDHVIEVADRRLAKPIDVIGGRLAQSAAHHHSQASAHAVVTGRAEYVESLSAPIEDLSSDRERECGHWLVSGFAGIE